MRERRQAARRAAAEMALRQSDATAWSAHARANRRGRRRLNPEDRRIQRASVEADLALLEREWLETGNPVCVFLADAALARADGLGVGRPAWLDMVHARWGDAIGRAVREKAPVVVAELIALGPRELEQHLAWLRDVSLATRVAIACALLGRTEPEAARLALEAEQRLAAEFGPRGATSPSAVQRAYRKHRHRLDPVAKRLAQRSQQTK